MKKGLIALISAWTVWMVFPSVSVADSIDGTYALRARAPSKSTRNGKELPTCGRRSVALLKEFAKVVELRVSGNSVLVNDQEWSLSERKERLSVAVQREVNEGDIIEIWFWRKNALAAGFIMSVRVKDRVHVCADAVQAFGSYAR